MLETEYSLGNTIHIALTQSKLVRGFFHETTTYSGSYNVGSDFSGKLIYSNSTTINKDIVKHQILKPVIEVFTSIGAKELVKLLGDFPFNTKNKLNFEDYAQNLVFDYADLSDLENRFLVDLQSSGKFKGYGGLRTKVDLKLVVEEFSKFYTVNLVTSVHYQFFLVVDAYENIKIDLSKNKNNFPDLEKTVTKQTTFKIEKE